MKNHDYKDGLINYNQAAEMLGFPTGTLYSLVSRNAIPHYRFGPRFIRFSPAKLSQWVEKQAILPTKDGRGPE